MVRTRPTVIDASVRAELDEMSDLAPLHNPPHTRCNRRLESSLAERCQAVACFDTAFHTSLKAAASSYALPTAWVERWRLRRYGFHGLSCEWSVSRAAELLATFRKFRKACGLPLGRRSLCDCHCRRSFG